MKNSENFSETLSKFRDDDDSMVDGFKCTPLALLEVFDNYMLYSNFREDESLCTEMYNAMQDYLTQFVELH